MQPMPSSPSTSSRSGSIHRFSIEYEGWWMSDRRPERAHDRRRLAGLLRRVRGDARVERLALPHGRVERAHRLLERRVRVEAVRVEDVDVVEAHPREALVEAREQVLARAPLAVRPGPHVVAGLRRDDELVAVRPQVVREDPAEVLLGRAGRRPVVVREVEVRDAEIERAAHDRALRVERPVWPKLCQRPSEITGSCRPLRPQRRYCIAVVAVVGGDVGHRVIFARETKASAGLSRRSPR